MPTTEEVEQTLSSGHETRGVEVKGPGLRTTDRHLVAKVAKAALGLGNLRGGGYIVVGIADDQQGEMKPGLSSYELASWLDFDELSRALAAYSDPPLHIDVQRHDLSSGATVAVVTVEEFEDIPHLCASDYNVDGRQVLRKGALYVRPRRQPETSEVAGSVEMREILDLATEKSLRRWVETARAAGLLVKNEVQPEPGDADLYASERDAGWS
jgi:predicted HTH transcriptional regulator